MCSRPEDGPVPRWWVCLWACLGALTAAAIALGPLEGIAHVQDEVAYRLQADILASGRLWEAERLPRASHHVSFVLNADGRRFGVFPNGWPAVLALGGLAGAPWAVNPILHAITVIVGARLAEALGGRRAGALAAAVLALSPQLVLLAASHMSHTLAALLMLAAVAIAHDQARRDLPSIRGALAVGAALGWLAFTRPLDGLIGTLALAVWAVVVRPPSTAMGAWTRRWGWAGLPLVAAGGLIALQNTVYTGHPAHFAVNAWFAQGEPPFPDPAYRYVPGCNRLGFGPDRGCEMTIDGFGHTPRKAAAFALDHLQLAGRLWLGTPVLLAAVAGVWWRPETNASAGAKTHDGPRRAAHFASWTLGLTAALALAYGLYWYGGACFGARFWHLAAPPTVIAAALGLERLRRRWPALPPVVAYLALLPMALRLAAAVPELDGYWGVDGRLQRFERRWSGGPALMLVGYGPEFAPAVQLPQTTNGAVSSFSAIRRRGMWIERRDGILRYAEYHPALVDAARSRFPERPAYVLVLTSDPRRDYVLPLAALPRAPQRDELDLPATPPPFTAPPP